MKESLEMKVECDEIEECIIFHNYIPFKFKVKYCFHKENYKECFVYREIKAQKLFNSLQLKNDGKI